MTEECSDRHSAETGLVEAAPEQVLDGVRIGEAGERAFCSGCDRPLHREMDVVCLAYRCVESRAWELPCVYCRACGPTTIQVPTLGASEVLVRATLGGLALPHRRVYRLCLLAPEVVVVSPPTEGRGCNVDG